MTDFKPARQIIEDDPRPGRHVTATVPEMVNKVQDIVTVNRPATDNI